MSKRLSFWLRNSILLILSGVIGFAAGWYAIEVSIESWRTAIWFDYDIVFFAIALMTVILLTMVIREYIRLPKLMNQAILLEHSKPTHLHEYSDQEQLTSPAERAVGRLVGYASVLIGLTSLWMMLSLPLLIHKGPDNPNEQLMIVNVIAALAFLVIAIILNFIVLKTYNRIYPSRKYDIYAKNPVNDYFIKLDEAEKSIVYHATYRVYVMMNRLMAISITILFAYSVLVQPEMLTILVLGIIWIATQITYLLDVYRQYRTFEK